MARQDFLNGEELINRLDQAWIKHNSILDASVISIQKVQTEYKKLPSDYLKIQREINLTLKTQSAAEQALTRAKQQSEKLSQEQIRTAKAKLSLDQQQTKVTQTQEKAQQKANAELAKAENIYNKVQAKINSITGTYNNLAAKRELGLKLNTREESQLSSLEKKLTKYQTVLKNVDAGIGKYSRNVGNYASGYDSLGNAINQLTREAPAFANSMQTGFMAISNNIPALADAIKDISKKNKELAESGEEPVSVLEELTDATFSWQTALSLGVTLLTVYGEKIVGWVSNLFNAEKALDSVTESQNNLTKSRVEGQKAVVADERILRSNLAIARDANLSIEDRTIAMKELRDQYPYYFKNLKDSQILAGDTAKAEAEITKALKAKGEAESAESQIVKNKQRILELTSQEKEEVDNLNKRESQRAKLLNQAANALGREERSAASSLAVSKGRQIQEITTNRALITREITELNRQNAKYEDQILKSQKESIGLRYKEETEEKPKDLQLEDEADYKARLYELRKVRIENEAEGAKLIADNEEASLERREKANRKYFTIHYQMAGDAYNEEQRLLDKKLKDEVSKLNQRVRDNEISEKNRNRVVFSLQKQHEYDSALAYTKFAEDIRKVNRELETSMKGVWDKVNFQKAENIIDERELELNTKYNETIKDIVKGNKDYREIQKANKAFQLASREITKDNIGLEIQKLEAEKATIVDQGANVAKRLELENQIIEKKKEFTRVTKEEADEQAAALEKLQKGTESYLNGFVDTAFADFGMKTISTLLKIDENGKTVFQNLMDGANSVGEKFQVAFATITEVAQEAFNFLSQNSNKRFENEYSNLEKQKEAAIKNAGDSTIAQEQINAQYEERKRQIRIREAKAQKDQALFNAIINTAQAVVAALPNIPLSVFAGILGAAQIALIANQPLPAYEDGTDFHPGGAMIVNDAKGSNYREMIKEPGKAPYVPSGRNVLMDAPKGTKVFKAGTFDKELNDLLSNNSIAPFASTLLRDRLPNISVNTGNGLTKQDLESVMEKYTNKSTFNLSIDEGGIHKYWQKGNGKTIILDNKFRITKKGL